ncbi:IS3 family transposase [Terrabacter sp. NPDC080008]|uniref:IS3 family transposase n=1 Tax=Terrabacter sp. NPDC080008 TaxID=3155176 RepID=UPI00345068AB
MPGNTSRRYPPELKARAVRMFEEIRVDHATDWEAMGQVAQLLGVSTAETVRKWVRQAQVDQGARPGVSSEESAEVKRLKREVAELRRANAILRSASGFLRGRARPALPVIVEFIREHAGHREDGGLRWGVEPICTVLSEHGMPIAPSTYYANVNRHATAREHRDALLLQEIRRVHASNYGVYGARKVWLTLNREGIPVARCTVERLMRQDGLVGAVRGKVRRTTIADPAGERARDLVGRNFNPAAPDRLWVADITYVSTWSGWVYVAFVIDAFARRILGWRTGTSMSTQLVLDALEQAVWTRERAGSSTEAVVAHTDRGSQYTSIRYTERLAEAHIAASVGTTGDSYDNALAETINGLYKTELIKRRGPWRTVDHVEYATAEWVDWFNHRRLYAYCGDVSPAELEAAYYAQNEAQQELEFSNQ